MYAVFVSGGKQYKVYKGDIIDLEKINHPIGEIITFDHVLLIFYNTNIILGNPFLKDSKIEAKIINHGRLKKIDIIKFNRRKHYKKKQGHRQYFTKITILNIEHNIGKH